MVCRQSSPKIVLYILKEKEFTNTGKIEVIRVAASDGLDTISGALTLGYLLNLEERAEAYAKFTDDIINYH